MFRSSVFLFLKDLLSVYFDRKIARSAAEFAFWATLTFFPLLICINAITDLMNITEPALVDWLSDLIPGSTLQVLSDYLDYVSTNYSWGLLIAGLILMISSSSAAFRSVMHSTGDIYERPLFRPIPNVIISVLASFVLLVVLYVSILIVVTGEWLLVFFQEQFSLDFSLLSFWNWARFLVLFAFLLLMLFLYYRLPGIGRRPRAPIIWGALLASAALVIVSIIFSWFIGMSSRYELVYGSLAAIVLLMLWLQLCGNILNLGSAFNFVYEKHWKKRLMIS